MKKLLFLIALISFTFAPFAQVQAPKQKVFRIELNEQELNALWYALDKSTAEHNTVKALQELIQKQVSDSTKNK